MRRFWLPLLILLAAGPALAQNNTFPATGYVGIGTLAPDTIITINGTIAAGSTGTLATLYTNQGATDAAIFRVRGVRYPTNSVRRIELDAYDGASAGVDLALQPSSGGNVAVGAYSAGSARLYVNGTFGLGTSAPDTVFTLNAAAQSGSTVVAANLYANQGQTDAGRLQISLTRHPTATVRRVM